MKTRFFLFRSPACPPFFLRNDPHLLFVSYASLPECKVFAIPRSHPLTTQRFSSHAPEATNGSTTGAHNFPPGYRPRVSYSPLFSFRNPPPFAMFFFSPIHFLCVKDKSGVFKSSPPAWKSLASPLRLPLYPKRPFKPVRAEKEGPLSPFATSCRSDPQASFFFLAFLFPRCLNKVPSPVQVSLELSIPSNLTSSPNRVRTAAPFCSPTPRR